MDLYEQQGQRDKLLAELEYHIFTLSSGGMEVLNRLKNICTPAQWIEYRERYLSGRTYHKLELMESEGLWERLGRSLRLGGFPSWTAMKRLCKNSIQTGCWRHMPISW